ncbi:hypothetical protein ACFDR9_000016 [Janthinobacterium sp. CG_23.3]
MSGRRKAIPVDSLLQRRQRLDRLPRKSLERAAQIAAAAGLYGVSATTVYWALQAVQKPNAVHRADHGKPPLLPQNGAGALLRADRGAETAHHQQGRAPPFHRAGHRADGGLRRGNDTGLGQGAQGPAAASDRQSPPFPLRLDQPHLLREPPALRFQAEHSNDCWQFDMAPSDLKHIDKPDWIDPLKGVPTLMLFSVVDDRSGVGYQEYQSRAGPSKTSCWPSISRGSRTSRPACRSPSRASGATASCRSW